MRCKTTLLLFGFLIAVVFGCGPSKAPEVAGNGEPAPGLLGDPLKTGSNADVAADEAKLAEMEKAIATKERELDNLRAEAAALRKRIAEVKAPKDKVYRKPEDLLADMPKHAYPKTGSEGATSRAAARKWVKANLVGRTVEWEWTVKDVKIRGDGPFEVRLHVDGGYMKIDDGFALHAGRPFGAPITLNGQSCQVMLHAQHFEPTFVREYTCVASEADMLAKLKGKKVTFRAIVTDTYTTVSDGVIKNESIPIFLTTATPSLDGFLPEANKPKSTDKK